MTKNLYNGYTKHELDRQHNHGFEPYLPDGTLRTMHARPKHMKESALKNKAYSEHCIEVLKPIEDIAYDDDPRQVFDLYKAEGDNAPCVIMLSGGQFMRGRTKVWSQWSKKCIENGISFIDLDHPQIPTTTLPDMMSNAEEFIYWIRDEAENYGIDSNRIILAGHSSGASVLATVIVRLANSGNTEGIKGVMLLSGNYDFLGPSLSFRQEFLKLTTSEVIECSAIRNLVEPLPPVFICAGEETDEMIRHMDRFHEAISWRSESERVSLPMNHFGIGMELYDDDSKMWKFIIKHIWE